MADQPSTSANPPAVATTSSVFLPPGTIPCGLTGTTIGAHQTQTRCPACCPPGLPRWFHLSLLSILPLFANSNNPKKPCTCRRPNPCFRSHQPRLLGCPPPPDKFPAPQGARRAEATVAGHICGREQQPVVVHARSHLQRRAVSVLGAHARPRGIAWPRCCLGTGIAPVGVSMPGSMVHGVRGKRYAGGVTVVSAVCSHAALELREG